MPDLSLADLAAFANQGKNQANSFAQPYLNFQQWQKNRMDNQAQQMGLPFVTPNLQAKLNLLKAQGGLTNANAANAQANANLTSGVTPSRISQAYNDQFTDPTVRAMAQLDNYAKNGSVNNLPQNTGNNNFGDFGNSNSGDINDPIPGVQVGGNPPNPVSASNVPSIQAAPGATNITAGSLQDKLLTMTPEQRFSFMQQLKSGQAGANTAAINNANMWNSMIKEADDKATNSYNTIKDIKDFDTNYDASFNKGAIRGKIPHYTSAEQAADQAATRLQQSFAQSFQPGKSHISDADVQLVGNAKPNRSLNPDAKNHIVDLMKSYALQNSEEQKFLSAAKPLVENGTLTPQQVSTLHQEYLDQRKAYDYGYKNKDPKTGKTVGLAGRSNDNFIGDWQPFLSPEAIAAVKSPTIMINGIATPSKIFVSKPLNFKDHAQFTNWFNDLSPENKRQVLLEKNNQIGN